MASTIIAFWNEVGYERLYKTDPDFDVTIRERFLATHEAATRGDLDWSGDAEGALALLILLDQFPRNMFRGTPMRTFFYIPFMHAEDLTPQRRSEALYVADGDADGLKWATIHREIIERFDRFPHRNVILGRAKTSDEKAFLEAGGFAG